MAIAAGVQVGLEGQTFDFFSLCSLSSLHWASEEQTERTIKRMGGQSSERQCGFQNEQKKREEREAKETGKMRSSVYGSMLGLQSVALSLWSITDSGWVFQGVSSQVRCHVTLTVTHEGPTGTSSSLAWREQPPAGHLDL